MPLLVQIFLFSESVIAEMFTKAKSNKSINPTGNIQRGFEANSVARRVISTFRRLFVVTHRNIGELVNSQKRWFWDGLVKSPDATKRP